MDELWKWGGGALCSSFFSLVEEMVWPDSLQLLTGSVRLMFEWQDRCSKVVPCWRMPLDREEDYCGVD